VSALFLVLFLVPAVALGWRIVVSKSRNNLLKVGGAAAAMTTIVGALVVYDNLTDFQFKDWRNDLALAAAVSGTVYLFIWALRHRTNQRHRTISLIAAIIGIVPFVATLATTLLFGQQQ
jgi:peptidoglycan/LPS O-acetylase OafA/YrhL